MKFSYLPTICRRFPGTPATPAARAANDLHRNTAAIRRDWQGELSHPRLAARGGSPPIRAARHANAAGVGGAARPDTPEEQAN
jgi:hypothetical protein